MLTFLGGAAYLAARLDPLAPPLTGMAQAADGDSLRLLGDRIRLQGIDAPELDQICWDASGVEWQCGQQSRARLSEMLAGGPTTCRPRGHDRYGRVLATCRNGARDVGQSMVSEGWALAYGDYEFEEAGARSRGLGIWRGRFVDPRTWRDEGPSGAPEQNVFVKIWNWLRELTGATALR